ncbi:VOC family protein [Rarobacter incanus]|uniref:VOC family protein n=1 Tax=Rarobacter incanus TaxID=153494 RepID=UPI00114DD707|nr:VOC family protein [Rarobacter incanus]
MTIEASIYYEEDGMSLRWHSISVGALDPQKLGRWWADALVWEVLSESEDGVVLVPPGTLELAVRNLTRKLPPRIEFFRAPNAAGVGVALAIEFSPQDPQDFDAEVGRIVELGATVVKTGEGDEAAWAELSDPEGNRFSIIGA